MQVVAPAVGDQIDKFHEEVSRWHLFKDIIEAADKDTTDSTSLRKRFTSAEEYLYYQKSHLKRDLRNYIAKHALTVIDKFKDYSDAQYLFTERQRLGLNGFAFTFTQAPLAEGEQAVRSKKHKLPKINEHDLVIAFYQGTEDIENQHLLCVAHSLVTSEGKTEPDGVVLKLWLRD